MEYGSDVTLSVEAVTPNDPVTYQWYIVNDAGEYEEIAGSTTADLTIENVVGELNYQCEVNDGETTASAYFTVAAPTLTAESVEYVLELEAGASGTLAVVAESIFGNDTITYSWYKKGMDVYEEITGETGAEMTVNQAGNYLCKVADSVMTVTVYFVVYMETGLAVTSTSSGSTWMASNGTAELFVYATTQYEEAELSYSWYVNVDGTKVQVDGTSEKLTLSNLDEGSYCYYCNVSDGYNSITRTFYVYVVELLGEPAASMEDAQSVGMNSEVMATIANINDSMYFSITPTESAVYTFYTNISEDTKAYLYDSSGNLLTSDDDGGTGSNFKITYELEAGNTYYLAARYYNECIGSFTVYIETAAATCSHNSLTAHAAVAATCASAGNIAYWTCDACGAMFSDAAGSTEVTSVTTAKLTTHTATGIWVTTKAATCTAPGTRVQYCKHCGTSVIVKSETIAATGHTATGTWVTTKAATCTEAGTRVQYCKDCGTSVVVKSETIAATGHTWGEWTTNSEATVFASETQTHTCSVCGAAETRTVGSKLAPTITGNATSIKLKVKQSTTALTVTGLAAGDSVVSWKSSNKKIVTVNSKGKITAKNKTGNAIITITLASGATQKIKVKVQKAAVKTTKVTVESKKLTLTKGKSTTLIPIITPITSVQKITYKSSNKKVATVSAKGKVVAKKKGTTTITIKSGSRSVKVKVTVK